MDSRNIRFNRTKSNVGGEEPPPPKPRSNTLRNRAKSLRQSLILGSSDDLNLPSTPANAALSPEASRYRSIKMHIGVLAVGNETSALNFVKFLTSNHSHQEGSRSAVVGTPVRVPSVQGEISANNDFYISSLENLQESEMATLLESPSFPRYQIDSSSNQGSIFIILFPPCENIGKNWIGFEVKRLVKLITKAKHPAGSVVLVKDLKSLKLEHNRYQICESYHDDCFLKCYDVNSMKECVVFAQSLGVGDYCEVNFNHYQQIQLFLDRCAGVLQGSKEYKKRIKKQLSNKLAQGSSNNWILGEVEQALIISTEDLEISGVKMKLYQILEHGARGFELSSEDILLLRNLFFKTPEKITTWIQEKVHEKEKQKNSVILNIFDKLVLKSPKVSNYMVKMRIQGRHLMTPQTLPINLTNKGPNAIHFNISVSGNISQHCFFSFSPNFGRIEKEKSFELTFKCVGYRTGEVHEVAKMVWEDQETHQKEYFYFPIMILVQEIPNQCEEEFWEIPHEDIDEGKLVGSGASADVRLCNLYGETVAVKTWMFGRLDKRPLDFERELKVYKEIAHPNLVAFIGAVTTVVGHASLVTEYFEKGSLDRILKNEKINLSWRKKMKMALEIASGMEYLHSKELIHRDLKSLNVLLDNHYHAKVSDFGESKSFENKTMTLRVGTNFWMAPEVLDGLQYSLSADVFSFGIVLWELITRKLPSRSDQEIVEGRNLPLPRDIPQIPREIMQKCWEVSPQKRPTFKDIRSALANYLQSLSTAHEDNKIQTAATEELQKMREIFHLNKHHNAQFNSLPEGKSEAAAPVLHTSPLTVEQPKEKVIAEELEELEPFSVRQTWKLSIPERSNAESAPSKKPTRAVLGSTRRNSKTVDDELLDVAPQISPRGSSPPISPRGSSPQISSPRGSFPQISPRGSSPQISSPRGSSPQISPRGSFEAALKSEVTPQASPAPSPLKEASCESQSPSVQDSQSPPIEYRQTPTALIGSIEVFETLEVLETLDEPSAEPTQEAVNELVVEPKPTRKSSIESVDKLTRELSIEPTKQQAPISVQGALHDSVLEHDPVIAAKVEPIAEQQLEILEPLEILEEALEPRKEHQKEETEETKDQKEDKEETETKKEEAKEETTEPKKEEAREETKETKKEETKEQKEQKEEKEETKDQKEKTEEHKDQKEKTEEPKDQLHTQERTSSNKKKKKKKKKKSKSPSEILNEDIVDPDQSVLHKLTNEILSEEESDQKEEKTPRDKEGKSSSFIKNTMEGVKKQIQRQSRRFTVSSLEESLALQSKTETKTEPKPDEGNTKATEPKTRAEPKAEAKFESKMTFRKALMSNFPNWKSTRNKNDENNNSNEKNNNNNSNEKSNNDNNDNDNNSNDKNNNDKNNNDKNNNDKNTNDKNNNDKNTNSDKKNNHHLSFESEKNEAENDDHENEETTSRSSEKRRSKGKSRTTTSNQPYYMTWSSMVRRSFTHRAATQQQEKKTMNEELKTSSPSLKIQEKVKSLSTSREQILPKRTPSVVFPKDRVSSVKKQLEKNEE